MEEEQMISPPPVEFVAIKSKSPEDSSDCGSSISGLYDDFTDLSAKQPSNKDPILSSILNLTASTSKTDLHNTVVTRSEIIDYASSNNRSRLQFSMEGGMRSHQHRRHSLSFVDLQNCSIQNQFDPCSRSIGYRSDPGNPRKLRNTESIPKEADEQSLPPDPPLKSILVPESQQATRAPKVKFSTVEIRSYERILGDNPSCSAGPSISIGWNFDQDKTSLQLIDEYEYRRMRRLEGNEMTLSRDERFHLLLSLGYSRREISTAVRSNIKVKKKRRQTVNNLSILPLEELLESLSKKFSVIMKKRVSSKHLYDEWRGAWTETSSLSNENHALSVSTGSIKSSMKKNTVSELASEVCSQDAPKKKNTVSELASEVCSQDVPKKITPSGPDSAS